MSVESKAEQRGHDCRPMTGADRSPRQENEKSGQCFWPGINRLTDEIRSRDVKKRGERCDRACAPAAAESDRAEKQKRVEDETDHGELIERTVRVQLRDVGPVAVEIMESAELGMIVGRAQNGAKRDCSERHQDGSVAHLAPRQDRPLFLE